MGWIDTGVARTRAMASEARAEVAETGQKLPAAKAWLKATTVLDESVNSLASSRVGEVESFALVLDAVRSQTAALRARATATVDELEARREAGESRLRMAEKSHRAMTRLAEESDKMLGE